MYEHSTISQTGAVCARSRLEEIERDRTPLRVCAGNDADNVNVLKSCFKRGNAQEKIHRHQESNIFSRSIKRRKLKQRIDTLRIKEEKILKERRELVTKQQVMREILALNPKAFRNADFGKIKVIPMSELLRKKHSLEISSLQASSALRLQRWWRNRMNIKANAFAKGVLELKTMMEKARVIQKWFRQWKADKMHRIEQRQFFRAALTIQRFTRVLMERLHQRKVSQLEESFAYFDEMKLKMQTDAQVRIAFHTRKMLKHRA